MYIRKAFRLEEIHKGEVITIAIEGEVVHVQTQKGGKYITGV